MLTPGEKLFEYEIIRPIGKGGFGAVFEAQDLMLRRRVAIKQLNVDKAKDQTAIKRFIQEARTIASLEHPNVVSIHSLRVADKQLYMVMEFLSNGSLADLLTRQGKLPVEQALHLTIGICEGLAKLHERDIVHRDIKPNNILLAADGRPKVIDFGIAHVPEAAGGMVLTQVGFQPSTLLYSSPEQVNGLEINARSDIYQIGEMLYHMLLGQHYIDITAIEKQSLTNNAGKTIRSMVKMYEMMEQAICQYPPPGMKRLWREVGSIAGVVERAMAKNPADRFKDAAEFAATLKTLSINTALNADEASKLTLQASRIYNKRGLAHVNTRNYEQAIVDYSRAIEMDTQYAEAYNNRSTAHLLMNNYGQAVVDCSQALALAPDFVVAYVNRGIAHTGLRNYEQAIADYSEALRLDPENVYAYYNRGNVYTWMGDPEKATGDYSVAIELEPHFVAFYVNRGIAYNELGQADLALADFDTAIARNPDYTYAYYNRANVYRELGQHEEAIADYSKVIALNPGHPHAYENRGDSFAAIGKEMRAAEDYTHRVIQTSAIYPKRYSVARSMLMPATPLDFLRHQSG